MNFKQFDTAMERKSRAIVRNILAAETQTVEESQKLFVQLSSGGLSTKTLRLLGHPYARRAPQAGYDPAIINSQTGVFRSKWKMTNPRFSSGAIRSSVVNTDPNAKYMFGTRRMVARPIDARTAALIQPRRMKRMRQAIRAALSA